MSYQDFPPSLLTLSPRVTRAGDPSASIVGINTFPLGDGAFVYCIENKGEYQLDRTSTATPDGDLVLQPSAGPGRWIKRLPASSSGLVSAARFVPVYQTTNGDGVLGAGGLVFGAYTLVGRLLTVQYDLFLGAGDGQGTGSILAPLPLSLTAADVDFAAMLGETTIGPPDDVEAFPYLVAVSAPPITLVPVAHVFQLMGSDDGVNPPTLYFQEPSGIPITDNWQYGFEYTVPLKVAP